jgi:signal transduction histidine kinase
MEVRKEPLEIGGFLRGLAQSVQGAARDKRVLLSARTAEGLQTILADRDKLEKIILNLLFNSIKFTPAGGRVELSAEEEGAFLVLRVRDTGMGISPKDLPNVFDRFWQADSSSQRKYQGTGIGLSLVKELAEVQGGSISVESGVGQGTVMTVKVPLEKTDKIPAAAEPSEAPSDDKASEEWLQKLYRRAELFPAMTSLQETLRPENYGRGRRPKIVVADDEPDMLRFLKTQLEKNFEVLEAVDGNQALEKARQYLPDLIILDMMMPGKDGIEVCRELREQTSTQSIPVILLTARADDETKLASLSAGASDFLTKPFSTTELNIRVRNLVQSHEYQRDLAREKKSLESAMEQLKETETLLVQNEKMASLGHMSAGIIHEINNPLNYASAGIHLLKRKADLIPEGDRAKYNETLADIEEGVQRVQHIVSDLRTFTHPHSRGTDLIELQEAVSTALRLLGHELKDGIKVEIGIPEGERVLADRNKLVQVFVNLIQNSMDAFKGKEFAPGEGPALSIQSRRQDGRVSVAFRDNGKGIDEENLARVFDPFFTTKDVGEGMGLGLSICYRILNEQGGSISVKSEKGKFTEFDLEMPSRD